MYPTCGQIHNFAGWDQRVWAGLYGILQGLAQISRGPVASGSCSDCFCCNMLQPWSAVVQIQLLQSSSNSCWWDLVPAPAKGFLHFPMGFLHGFRCSGPASSLRWKWSPTKCSQPEGKDLSATCSDGDREVEMVMELWNCKSRYPLVN